MECAMMLVFLLLLLGNVCGKITQRKTYPRQMIIPNKFIPMLKESSLFKSRAPNDLSGFLKPNSQKHNSVTGETRQNLMSSLGMNAGESAGMGAGNDMGGTDAQAGMGGAGGMVGMTGEMGGTRGEGGMDALGAQQGIDGAQDTGGMMGMNDQMNSMNGMGGNSQESQAPLGENMGGNGINTMANGGADGVNFGANNPPAGDPMGTLKDMLSNQGTNSALGTDSQAFGPGGEANSNVVAMLNQIVGKEMPGESPVDPSSKSEQVWDQLQKNFASQKPSGVPYIDSTNTQSATENVQHDAAVKATNPKIIAPNTEALNTSITSPPNPLSPPNTSTKMSSTSNMLKADSASKNVTPLNPPTAHSSADHSQTTNPISRPNSNIEPHSQSGSHKNSSIKTTSSIADTDVDEDQPLSADMVKFLRGVKFVISQEPGNDIILGKKFSSDVPSGLTNLREENGVMKNVVSATNKALELSRQNALRIEKSFPNNVNEYDSIRETVSMGKSSSERSMQKQFGGKSNNALEYIKAANVLQSAAKKLKDPVAKKSTEVAIASILKVVSLGDKKILTTSADNLLNGGDVKNKLSDKYVEAARVLGTASRKLADPVAKKSTEIGIACILKVITLGEFPTSKKAFVPIAHRVRASFSRLLNMLTCCNDKKYENMGNDLADAIKKTLRQNNNSVNY